MEIVSLAPLRLNKHEDRRLRAGHVWVFSNEVDNRTTPLTQFEPGQPISIEDASGRVLGTGYVNPHALICARLVSRDPNFVLNQSLLVHRLNVALSLRQRLFPLPYYRLVFGEADGLPGLVIDRYDDVLVAQITTAGMERLKDEIKAALVKVIKPKALLFRNDTATRELEGLSKYIEVGLGDVPDTLRLEENGTCFDINVHSGQKTGWFYDQRANRTRLRLYVSGLRVLDVFSYLGAFGVQAAAAGAEAVVCIESSAKAVEGIQHNAKLNGVDNKITVLNDDAFDALRNLRSTHERFDVVILDPPALIKRKKDLKQGTNAYQRLNQMAMQILAKDGILVSCSCSYHLPRETLQDILLKTSRHVDRFLQLLEPGYQGPDHPVHPAIPETAYLKIFFSRLLPN